MKRRFISLFLIHAILICTFCLQTTALAQQRRAKPKRGRVCGDPTMPCKTTIEFEPFDLPFEVPKNVFIAETEKFYAVMLKSFRAGDNECESKFISEDERLLAQVIFPVNKVFASRCPEPGNLFYEPINYQVRFMAVFAGRTRAEANKTLALVKATGKFSGAYIKQLHAGFNGT